MFTEAPFVHELRLLQPCQLPVYARLQILWLGPLSWRTRDHLHASRECHRSLVEYDSLSLRAGFFVARSYRCGNAKRWMRWLSSCSAVCQSCNHLKATDSIGAPTRYATAHTRRLQTCWSLVWISREEQWKIGPSCSPVATSSIAPLFSIYSSANQMLH